MRRPILEMHKVAEIIHARLNSRSMPHSRIDGHKLALVIEGGGMRGVVSGAMVAALEQLDALNCFDVVYGSSAGAISGAYFVARQARYGVTIFYENINNTKFVDPRRLILGRPVVNLEFLLDQVCIHEKPLNTEAVIASNIPLKVIATSLSTTQRHVFDHFNSPEDLFTALRCSARIPILAGAPVKANDDLYYDAAISESIPFKIAIEDKCTAIVALLTRPAGKLRGKADILDRFVVAPRLAKYNPDLPRVYLDRARRYVEELKEIMTSTGQDGRPPILPIQLLKDELTVSSRETSRTNLLAGAKAGYSAVYRSLGFPEPRPQEVLMPLVEVSG